MIDDYNESQWTNQSIDTIPIIDITPLLLEQHDENRFKCIQSIHQSCLQYGFFYISNISSILSSLSLLSTSSTTTTITKFQSTISKFFKLPMDILQSIQRTKHNSRGFFNNELTKNKQDWKYCFDFGSQNGSLDHCGLDGFNQWPPLSKGNDNNNDDDNNNNDDDDFEVVMRDYYRQMEILAKILLRGIVESLLLFGPNNNNNNNNTNRSNGTNGGNNRNDVHVDANILNQYFDGCHTSYLRLNYYPKCPNPSSNMAIHHHTDAGALTILYQDNHVSSLQVFNQSEQKWYYIPPKDDTFVINIGDMVQVWSNDLYKAPLHRVRANSEVERYSAPFFYNPAYHTDVKPLFVCGSGDSDEDDDNDNHCRPKYRPLNWGEFRAKRFAGDYADVGEEVQISHYRID